MQVGKNHRTSKQMETTDGMKINGRWFNEAFRVTFCLHSFMRLYNMFTLKHTQAATVKPQNLCGPQIWRRLVQVSCSFPCGPRSCPHPSDIVSRALA